ncbi:MAG TPA: DNA-directed RNA polymerase subunit H [Candidatus Thermoplasmatota archaeon]
MPFETLNHILVPEHQLMTEEKVDEVLKRYNIKLEQLPKIRRSDAAIRALEIRTGEILKGSVIKVVRYSETAGISVSYRLVVD